MAVNPLLHESIWFEKWRVDDAERQYHERLYQQKFAGSTSNEAPGSPAKVVPAMGGQDAALAKRIDNLENENKDLRKVTEDLRSLIGKMEARIAALEKSSASGPTPVKAPAPAPAPKDEEEDEDDDDFELFGSDDEEDKAEQERIKQQRIKEYQEKKAKKPGPIAKSNVVLDCKPWDDETDMKKMEELVRSIEMDGLRWGASQLVDLAYGIKKLQICCIIEDEKVSTEDLQDLIVGFEDYVQSTDIAAFQKV